MPTRRRKMAPDKRTGLTPKALEAWRIGDWHALNRELGLDVQDIAVRCDVSRAAGIARRSYRRAFELRAALIDLCGPPGRVGRHGNPLGPARPRKKQTHADRRRKIGPQRIGDALSGAQRQILQWGFSLFGVDDDMHFATRRTDNGHGRCTDRRSWQRGSGAAGRPCGRRPVAYWQYEHGLKDGRQAFRRVAERDRGRGAHGARAGRYVGGRARGDRATLAGADPAVCRQRRRPCAMRASGAAVRRRSIASTARR